MAYSEANGVAVKVRLIHGKTECSGRPAKLQESSSWDNGPCLPVATKGSSTYKSSPMVEMFVTGVN